MAMNSLVVQWFKDPELSLQHLGSLLWHGYDPGAGKKKKKKIQRVRRQNILYPPVDSQKCAFKYELILLVPSSFFFHPFIYSCYRYLLQAY